MSPEVPWEAWFHKEHADANRLLTENYLLRRCIEELEAANGALEQLRDAREMFITSLASRLREAEDAKET